MVGEINVIKNKAEEARILYVTGVITREQALTDIMPYINAVNARSKELAKKYNQRPRLVNFNAYVR